MARITEEMLRIMAAEGETMAELVNGYRCYMYLRDKGSPDSPAGIWVAKEGTNSWGKTISRHLRTFKLDRAIAKEIQR